MSMSMRTGNYKEGSIKASAKKIGVTEKFYRDQTEKGLKRCSGCHEWKDRKPENFPRCRDKGDGLSNYCLVCTRKTRKKQRERAARKL